MKGSGRAVILAGAIALAAGPAGAVNSDGGVCGLNVTITFGGAGQKMKSVAVAPTSPSYSISVSGKDVPVVGGIQHCAYNLDFLTPWRTTSVSASPTFMTEDLWTCEAVLGFGTWTQSWSPEPPGQVTAMSYTITGTWGAWTLAIRSPATIPSFVAVVPLTFATPDKALEYGKCIDASTGISQLALTGVQVFQDP